MAVIHIELACILQQNQWYCTAMHFPLGEIVVSSYMIKTELLDSPQTFDVMRLFQLM